MQNQPKALATPEHRRRVPVKGHPGIFKRGSRYQVMFRDNGKQRTRSFRTLSEAKRFKGRVDTGDTKTSSRRLFREYAVEWIEQYEGRTKDGISENTRDSYRDAIQRMAIPYFGSIRLDRIDPPFLKGYIAHMAAQYLAASTVRRYFAPISALLAEAYEDGLLRQDPSKGIRIVIRGENGRRRTKTKRLSPEEVRAIYDETPEDHRDLVYLLATSAMRISEALALTWGDLIQSFDGQPMVQITKAKTASGVRDVHLSPEAARMLLKRRDASPASGNGDPIFPNNVGRPMNANNFRRRVFNPTAIRAGVGWATPHDLRHALATRMAEQRFSPAEIAAHLGHADGGVLAMRTYVHVDAVDSMEFADYAFDGPGSSTTGIATRER